MEAFEGYIYCITHSDMPGRVKIGMTERTPEERCAEANRSTWSLPLFQIEFAKRVSNPLYEEKRIHTFFSKERIHPRREWFALPLEKVKPLFDIIDGTDWDPNTTFLADQRSAEVCFDMSRDMSAAGGSQSTSLSASSSTFLGDRRSSEGCRESSTGMSDDSEEDNAESENDEDENVSSGAGGGEGIGPKGNRTKDAMRLYFKDGQQIRHAIGNDIWYGTYKYSINKIVREDIQYSALSAFAKQHHVSVGSTSAGGNGWTVCYCEVENGKWIPANDLPKNTIGSSE